ncbi:MAG: carboxypeptidase-like regulatory domain-containing protein [Pirellulaceae bacterium]
MMSDLRCHPWILSTALSLLAATAVAADDAVVSHRDSLATSQQAQYRFLGPRDQRRNHLTRLPPLPNNVSPDASPVAAVQADGPAGTADPPIDGTWHDEGRYIVIHVNGQQLRLVKSDSAEIPHPVPSDAGDVDGRLSHRGQPLVDCDVELVPLRKAWSGYAIHRSGKRLHTTTNDRGAYHLADVPPGAYKLKWRPAGQQAWIRRAEIRPDVRVVANETSHVKEIRLSLRTLN